MSESETSSSNTSVTLGSLDPSQYKPSQQSKWTPEKIAEKLQGYHLVTFKHMVENKDLYIGTIVRYFRNGLFRSGGIVSNIDVVEDGDPPVGYVGFFSVKPRTRWTSQSDTSEFWVQDDPKKPRSNDDTVVGDKKKRVKKPVVKDKDAEEKANVIETIRQRWFTEPAKLAGETSEEKRIYVVIDLDTWTINTAPKANSLKLPDKSSIPTRVVYNRVQEGNRKPYRKKYFISRLNYKTLDELHKFLVTPQT